MFHSVVGPVWEQRDCVSIEFGEKNIHASRILCHFYRMWQCKELSASFSFDTRPAHAGTIRVRTIYGSELVLFRFHVIWFWCVAQLVSCHWRDTISSEWRIFCVIHPFFRFAWPARTSDGRANRTHIHRRLHVQCRLCLWRDWMPKWWPLHLFICLHFRFASIFFPQQAQQATAIGAFSFSFVLHIVTFRLYLYIFISLVSSSCSPLSTLRSIIVTSHAPATTHIHSFGEEDVLFFIRYSRGTWWWFYGDAIDIARTPKRTHTNCPLSWGFPIHALFSLLSVCVCQLDTFRSCELV